MEINEERRREVNRKRESIEECRMLDKNNRKDGDRQVESECRKINKNDKKGKGIKNRQIQRKCLVKCSKINKNNEIKY